MAWLAKATAATARLFQRVKDLGATDKVLEFGVGLAAHDLLEAAYSEAKGSKNVRTFSTHCKQKANSNRVVVATLRMSACFICFIFLLAQEHFQRFAKAAMPRILRTASRLSHLDLVAAIEMGLEGVRPAVGHLVGLHHLG